MRASEQQRRVILTEFEHSGVSAAEFAKLTALKYSTLAGWVQRYRRGQNPEAPPLLRPLEAVVKRRWFRTTMVY